MPEVSAVTDNRTGTYEMPIENGAIHATAFRR